MDTSTNTYARRVRLSTSAIALAVTVTVAAVAAVFYSAGDSQVATGKFENLISSTRTR